VKRQCNGDEQYTLRLALCSFTDMSLADRIMAHIRQLPGITVARANVADHQITLWLRSPTEESVIRLNEVLSSFGWRVAAANLQAGWIGKPTA
jgi:hypothetical protein